MPAPSRDLLQKPRKNESSEGGMVFSPWLSVLLFLTFNQNTIHT